MNKMRRKLSAIMAGVPYDARVEYLESSGTQYIDLGIKAYNTDVVMIKFQLLSIPTYSVGLFGCRTAINLRQLMLTVSGTSPNPLNYNVGWSTSLQILSPVDLFEHTIEMDLENKIVTVDGTNQYSTGAFQALEYDLYLLNRNFAGVAQSPVTARIMALSIGSRMNLIPVRVGQVGYMYDTISRRLLGNVGTGDFIVGPDL